MGSNTFKIKNTTKSIAEFLKPFNYMLESEYKNNHSPMNIKCEKLHQFFASWLEISKWSKKGSRKFCPVCRRQYKHGSKDIYIWWYGDVDGIKEYEKYKENFQKGHSLERYIEKYGKELGEKKYIKWKSYGISLENYIEKYGNIEGEKKWQNYLLMHSTKRSLKNYIDRLGPIDGPVEYDKFIQRNRKSKTLDGFKEKYGEKLGEEKFKKWINGSASWGRNGSKISIKHILPPILNFGLKINDIFIGIDGSKEFCLLLKTGKFYWYDCMIPDLKIIIEFNSNAWHPNPDRLKENFISWKPPRGVLTAQEKYRYDIDKINAAEKAGYTVLIIWEEDGIENNHSIISHLLNKTRSDYII